MVNGANGEKLQDLVDPAEFEKLDAWECPECWAKGFIVLARTGQHIKASCARCGRYYKFVRQNLPPEERAKWDAKKAQR